MNEFNNNILLKNGQKVNTNFSFDLIKHECLDNKFNKYIQKHEMKNQLKCMKRVVHN